MELHSHVYFYWVGLSKATELHDKLKLEVWRIATLGETPALSFEEAYVRWIEEKGHKKSLDDDKGGLSSG